jgi:hypothetical protein
LRPNEGSPVAVERYALAVFAANVDGSPHYLDNGEMGTKFLSGTQKPDAYFRPQRATTNVPAPGMIIVTSAKIANITFMGSPVDAWMWNANARDEQLDLPTVTPADKATFAATYFGGLTFNHAIPNHLSDDSTWLFIVSFTGPATITGLGDDLEEPL